MRERDAEGQLVVEGLEETDRAVVEPAVVQHGFVVLCVGEAVDLGAMGLRLVADGRGGVIAGDRDRGVRLVAGHADAPGLAARFR